MQHLISFRNHISAYNFEQMVLLFALPILIVEEGLKFVGRRIQRIRLLAHEMQVGRLRDFANGLREGLHGLHGPRVPSPMF